MSTNILNDIGVHNYNVCEELSLRKKKTNVFVRAMCLYKQRVKEQHNSSTPAIEQITRTQSKTAKYCTESLVYTFGFPAILKE